MENSVQTCFRNCQTCKAIWDIAKVRYSNQVTRAFDVMSDMLRAQGDMDVVEYYDRFQNAMMEFRDVFPRTTYRPSRD